MNTKFFVFSAFLVGISAFSQEIKIKKGELLLDNKVVAIVSDRRGVFSFNDLNDKLQFTAQTRSPDQNENGWVEFTGENGNIREANYADTGFTLNLGKLLVQNAMAQGLITIEGINDTKVKEFFSITDRSVSQAREKTKTILKEQTNQEDAVAKDNGIVIDDYGQIWNKNKELVGFIRRVNTENTAISKSYEYSVYDNNKILIGKLACTNSDKYNNRAGLKIYTYDNKAAEITVEDNDFQAPLSKDKMADRMVKKLYTNGYTLGDMRAAVEGLVNRNNQEAENNAKAQSKNIYDVPGYVIDKTGAKKVGNITIEFESIKAILGREKGIADLTRYGAVVVLNSNGKNESFKAKDGIKFCAGEHCFIGVEGVGMLGGRVFTEILSENNGSYVLLDIKNPQDYYLKLANQPKAVYLGEKGDLGRRKSEKIKKIFDE
nr:hypothetical protein [uncultured Chryseobacterium sp.]